MDYDDAYANAAYIKDAKSYPPRWEQTAQDWRAVEHSIGRARLNIAYGESAREKYDLFLPAGRPKGVVMFIHGGYWRAFDNKSFSHLAAGATARDWAVAMPGYTLAPEARISQITAQIAQALEVVAKATRGPIVLTGHSAGGHLAARMLCGDVALSEGVQERLQKVVPISPLSDLRPLLHTAMNEDFHLDMDEAMAESPLLAKEVRPVPTHVWVGAAERPAFLDQARWLAEGWESAKLTIAPEKHHFDVIDDLADEESTLTDVLLG